MIGLDPPTKNNPPTKNSEILLIYEVKMANPNGDPDDENRPRMDPKTRTNIVTDVRVKRFFRDLLISRQGEDKVWVSKVDGKNVDATTKLEKYGGNPEDVLNSCVDARLFGATIPKKGEKKGESISFTGPLQLSWGYSLHRVDLMDTRSITSIFSGRDTGAGNIGKDYRVYYSLLAFYGAFSYRRAQRTKASVEDLKIFDNLIWEAILSESVTRSKIGHYPHLYMRVEWPEADRFEGDLRRFVKVKERKEAVRGLEDLELDFSALIAKLKQATVYSRCSQEMSKVCEEMRKVANVVNLPHPA
ncbi:type I-B CRISPR-associated protein Cas7/Csh2 [Sulfodiicoccus acidiphilus]|uniref:Type I-B CRISPR-associated protein Cas7/Csh2 n=1 Tax=Sulfodiicoccus acidiphilus TaxID=1670455 RepID=A0A348B599_9CREN|nr:type I-B CRISPR-associated protein Cas7/Csh2 [Sulfodiicoccus acidiphilus]BBD73351.1 type I-B CRISPR-associated protein Cas7/Csh2 [Sulfodiicoccus acidiphilus]GGT88910.1 type I-B CRISPR-associated protein Cas7/Csh2 [Sulfodiicoccus acidiphilus]